MITGGLGHKPNISAHLTSWIFKKFLENYLFGNLWSFFYFWTNKQEFFDKNSVVTSQNCKKELKNLFSQTWVILGSNQTVFIKFIGSILSKRRRMIIDCQLNSLLENCLKTQLVGFRWADVLGFRLGQNKEKGT